MNASVELLTQQPEQGAGAGSEECADQHDLAALRAALEQRGFRLGEDQEVREPRLVEQAVQARLFVRLCALRNLQVCRLVGEIQGYRLSTAGRQVCADAFQLFDTRRAHFLTLLESEQLAMLALSVFSI